MNDALLIGGAFAFAGVWFALGHLLGSRRAERRLLRAIEEFEARPIPSSQGSSVLRRGNEPERNYRAPDWSAQ